jgi:GTP cyclohydrolase II
LTNHPRRLAALEGFDIEIVEQIPVELKKVNDRLGLAGE